VTPAQTKALQIASGFERHLGAHQLSDIDAEPGSVIGLWPDGRIALLNSAWQRFAAANDGADALERWPLDAELLSAVSGRLRDYYERAFATVRADGKPWEQCYQCLAPGVRRRFRLRVLPLSEGSLLLVHTRVVDSKPIIESDAGSSPDSPDRADYVGPRGMIRQCSNCRRTQRVRSLEWDWVDAYVKAPPSNISHGICPLCMRQDYPDLG
jgi:hypothetical protein